MKFPLYNECPNCGHKTKDHEVDRNGGCWGAGHHQEPYNVWVLSCPCPLTRPDIHQAISIQVAVEALARQKNA